MSFFEQVYEVVKRIPKGKVTSYGQIAKMCGNHRMARQVGWALHANPSQKDIPCHRVVNKDGFLSKGYAFGGIDVQKAMLENEGIVISDAFQIDMKKYDWGN